MFHSIIRKYNGTYLSSCSNKSKKYSTDWIDLRMANKSRQTLLKSKKYNDKITKRGVAVAEAPVNSFKSRFSITIKSHVQCCVEGGHWFFHGQPPGVRISRLHSGGLDLLSDHSKRPKRPRFLMTS